MAGIGFAKTLEGNCSLMGGMERVRTALRGPFHHLPILAGPSRKGFLGRLTGAPDDTSALATMSVTYQPVLQYTGIGACVC